MIQNNLSEFIASVRGSIDEAVTRVLNRAWFILGPEVESLEQAFAKYIGVKFCRALANGTDALELALRGLGVAKDDMVATVANAGFYTSTALLAIGAIPFYLDVDLKTHVISLNEIERAIQQGVKYIVVTHLYGRAIPDIAKIATCCHASGVFLIEDCAQAHGAVINGKKVGSFGDIGCFSFYPTKNLGALGDAGAIVCNSAKLAKKMTCLRQYGWSSKYQVEFFGGCNSRLDEIQAAILMVFLPYLDSRNTRRREIASQYSTLLRHPEILVLPIAKEDYVAHLYVIRTSKREELREYLAKLNIATEVHYPIPDHQQPIFGNKFLKIILPNTEQLSNEILTLPCYPEMQQEDINRVIEAINSWPMN